LKQQRNALIKAFHPDNNESNETYAQKINAAYELLSGMIKEKKKEV
jgi:DnaJ-class molecular chaperone